MKSSFAYFNQLSLLIIALALSSCVSYLPPSSLHQDMRPTYHPVYEGEDVQQLSLSLAAIGSDFHHRDLPEAEDSDSKSIDLQYAIARERYSAAIGGAYSFGTVTLSGVDANPAQNAIVRSSISMDETHGRLRINLIKFQLAASRGFGEHQDSLAANSYRRDEFNYIFNKGDVLWSLGFGSHAQMLFDDMHSADMGFYLNHSSDFRKAGFREDFFTLQMGYMFQRKFSLTFGTMFDARLLPRAETGYLSLGYHYTFQ